MDRIISNETDIKLNILEYLPTPIGDAIFRAVDINDIKEIGTGDWLNSSSALLHETYEQYQVQAMNKNIYDAHVAASNVEFSVTGGYIHPEERDTVNGKMVLPVYQLTNKDTRIGTVILHINNKGDIYKIERNKWEE